MDRINNTLLLSLQQEVKTLNDIVNDLPIVKDIEEIRSWLYPAKPSYFVNELICRDEIFDFKTCLELIIDRLYVGMHLILNYVEENKERKQEDNHRFIHRPKLISLGFTFQRLWQAVATLFSHKMSINTKRETATGGDNWTKEICNKEVQTNIISLNKCDSCSSAMLCMKNLMECFNKSQFNKRQLLRPKLYDITQFGCMLQTTTAIEKGVNALYEKLFSVERDRNMLRRENEELKVQINEKCAKITFLEQEADVLKDKCGKENLKIILLGKQKEELGHIKNKQECQIKTLTEVVSNLDESIKDYNEKIFKMAFERENLLLLYTKITKNQMCLVKFCQSLHTNLSVLQGEHSLIKKNIIQLEQVVDNLNKKMNKTTNIITATDRKITNMSKPDLTNVSVLESKLQEFRKTFIKRCQEKSLKEDVRSQTQSSFQVKGNPIEDLTRQLQENNVAIKKLENENIKLNCIISKLGSLKK